MAAVPRAMFAILFSVCVIFGFTSGVDPSESEKESVDVDTCVQEFIDWCKNLEQDGTSIISISYYDGEQNYRVCCGMNSNGTNCTKNGSSWFYCSPDNILFYKGEELSSATADGEVCETKDRARNMFSRHGIVIGGRDMPFNQTAYDIHRRIFDENMRAFRQRMRELQRRLYNQMLHIFGGEDKEDMTGSKIWTAIQPSAGSYERESDY